MSNYAPVALKCLIFSNYEQLHNKIDIYVGTIALVRSLLKTVSFVSQTFKKILLQVVTTEYI